MQRYFVTGASGFVGTHLTRRLLENDKQVVALVRDDVPWELYPSYGLTRIFGDIRDTELIFRVLVEYDIEAVIHLAAQAIVPKALLSPFETFDVNVRGTYSLLDACRRYKDGIKGILIQSSDKALGTQKVPYKEHAPLLGVYPYDASKAAEEVITKSYRYTYELPVVVTRCANIYGPGDINETRIIPGTIASILRNERPVIRSDGTPLRDYIYVSDAVEGILTALNYATEPFNPFALPIFHFGSGYPVSVLELVDKILEISDSSLEPNVQGTAKSEIDIQYIDTTWTQSILDWNRRVFLEDGLRETIDWWKSKQ